MSMIEFAPETDARAHACPECHSGSTIQIIYGVADALLIEAADDGEVILGGWLYASDAPTRHCKGCGAEWVDVDDYIDRLRD
ncbi:hypothetical protein WDJ51_15445 [Rathayibacter sp. YIM 133350]|uniref:hypothetical protein n=1 Tax=Rathayibacter sp. YIM 133350 TaxID=3131992 RepID=UPI00307F4143